MCVGLCQQHRDQDVSDASLWGGSLRQIVASRLEFLLEPLDRDLERALVRFAESWCLMRECLRKHNRFAIGDLSIQTCQQARVFESRNEFLP